MSGRVRVTWMLDDNVPLSGVRGVDYEMVSVEDLVKWAKRRRRQLRRDIKRGIIDAERQRAERHASAMAGE